MESSEKIEFRDGERWVPGYLSHLFAYTGIETHMLTYDEAVKAANQGLLRKHTDAAQQALVRSHFRSR